MRPHLRRLAAALLLAAAAACQRAPQPAAAPFGGRLVAPLPHADVLGACCAVPGTPEFDALAGAHLGGLNLGDVQLLEPPITMLRLAREHPFVPAGGAFALLFLDADVHGGIAAYAWRGDASALRASAAAAGLLSDADGRLLLPGVGRAHDVDSWITAFRRSARSGGRLPSGRERDEEQETDAEPKRPEAEPTLPHAIVERDGVVMVLPALDGARNVRDTLDATGLLDAPPSELPCLRLALGRVVGDLRSATSQFLSLAINHALFSGSDGAERASWRIYTRLTDLLDGALEAVASMEEVFVRREGAAWHAYLRMEEGSYGAGLLSVAVNRPLDDLLKDVPGGTAFVAGQFDPQELHELPTLRQRTARGFFRSRNERRFYFSDRDREERAEEERRAGELLDATTGRFWIAADLGTKAPAIERRRGVITIGSDALGDTRIATFVGTKGDDPSPGLADALVDVLLPTGWRTAVRLASPLLYRAARRPDGVLEIFASDGSTAQREMLDAMERGTTLDGHDAPPEAFLVASGAGIRSGPLGGDLCLTRHHDGVEIVLKPAAP